MLFNKTSMDAESSVILLLSVECDIKMEILMDMALEMIKILISKMFPL